MKNKSTCILSEAIDFEKTYPAEKNITKKKANNILDVVIPVFQGKSYIYSINSSSIKGLVRESKNHDIEFPDVEFIVVENKETYDFYYQFQGFGDSNYLFSLKKETINFSANSDEIIRTSIFNYIDNINWHNLAFQYLKG